MSLYSDHAANVNRITERQAAIDAERLRRKGDFRGGLLSMLGQIPMQILEQRDQNAQQQRNDARQSQRDQLGQLEIEDKLAARASRRELTQALQAAKTPLEVQQVYERFDPEMAEKVAARNRKVVALRLQNTTKGDYQTDYEIAKKYLGPDDLALLPTPEQYPDTPDFSWKQPIIDTLTGTLRPPKEQPTPKAPEDFTLGPGQQRVRPDGTVIASVPAAERGQASVANPTEASLARDAASADPAISGPAQKALELLRKQRPSSQGGAESLVPVPGPNGPVYGVKRPGEPVYEKPPAAAGDTAQDRQRSARLDAARGFLDRLNVLRTKINTKMGPEAGATGLLRRGAAAVGMDPDVAEYERERAAAGRALAVAIMGAQNLSDADAKAWGDLLPGATVDRETAQRLMTQVEDMLKRMNGDVAAAPASGAPPPGAWAQMPASC